MPESTSVPNSETRSAPSDIVGRHSRLAHRTALIAAFTAVSRVLGYGREVLCALLFGDRSPVYDVFITAWRVPNLFRRLLGEGAVSTALQASLTEVDGDHGDEAGRRLFWDVVRLATLVMVAISALIMGAVSVMPDRMPLTGWTWLGPEPGALRDLLVRVTPYLILICLAGLAGGAVGVRGRFFGSSAGAGAMNLVAVLTLVVIGLRFGWSGPGPADGAEGYQRHLHMARWFSWGLLLSGVVQLVMLVPDMRRADLLGRPRGPGDVQAAKRVLVSSLPLALGAAVYQVNVMVDGFMAYGLLSEGGATTYYLAIRLQQLPLALVATAATSAVFPALKALAHRGELQAVRDLHDRTHLAICFLALPATAGLVVLARPIVEILLRHGEFGEEGVLRTTLALQVLATSLIPTGAAGLVARTYYALGDFTTPVRISVAMLFLNLALNAALVVGLDMDVEGLALATSVASWVNLFALLPGLTKRLGLPRSRPGLRGRVLRMAIGSALCSGTALWICGARGTSPVALAAALVAAVAVYVGAAHALKIPEWQDATRRLRGWTRGREDDATRRSA